MSTLVLSDMGRVRSAGQWQTVELAASAEHKKADTPATTTYASHYIGDWDKLIVEMNMSAAATDATTDYILLHVDMSMDGLAWYNVGAFTKWEGDDGTTRELMVFVPGKTAEDPDAIIIGSTDASSTVIRQHLVGRYIRYRAGVVDNATDAAFTYSIMAHVWRNDIIRDEENEMKEIELLSLAARTTVAATSTDIWEIGDSWDWMQVVLRTTAHATDTGDHLDVNLYLSVDGTDWISVGAFTQTNGDDGPWVELMTLLPDGVSTNVDAAIVVTAAAAETVLRTGFAGGFLKAIYTVTNTSTDDASFTFALKAYIK
ncbi:hypothetical protein LCGC14_2604590 [marine sediment metagenome]|uniref:Uncharacterized protein n=1 Tax=marine sediment metagenome TaxID=412755 RepID=A0A0F9D0G0_9ZZZZ